MTDKSFGDHTGRNIVKNPLLSTAVTGLSFEDLTHNAVLFPVSQSQEVITRPDQFGTQARPPSHSDHATTHFPSGDANSNAALFHSPPNIVTHPQNISQTIKTEKPYEKPSVTVSKASVKTDDDFDVNEYFARLHGSRYVSAPLNCNIKEDQNANLEETEENLEEINLNEPPSQTDIQQSITADIAQNFSQLPTVLPQVASAVFSSFSNMLSLKSREHTPDEVKPVYQQLNRPQEENVELIGVTDPVKETAPPPKEPPISGTGNYRLATKKKYAQIPGLTSGDVGQMPLYNPMDQNVPSHFVPTNPPIDSKPEVLKSTIDATDPNKDDNNIEIQEALKEKYVVNPTNYNVTNIPNSQMNVQSNIEFFRVHKPDQVQPSNITSHNTAAIIPPPVMFSNAAVKDSQAVGRAILPPSVARRISANQPILKHQPPQAISAFDNIFVPTPVLDTNIAETDPIIDSKSPSAFATFSTQSLVANEPSIFTPASLPLSSSPNTVAFVVPSYTPPPSVANTSVVGVSATSVTNTPIEISPETSIFRPGISQVPESSADLTTLSTQSTLPPIGQFRANSSSASFWTPPKSVPMPPNISTLQSSIAPTMFTPTSVTPQSSETNFPPPPIFFNPSTVSFNDTPKDFQNIQTFPQFLESSINAVETSKPILEPPKASGNVNYRMTKKRPQYYSGPIEGVGAISNYVKPVIPPIETSAFHGALFTPAQQVQETVDQDLTVSCENPSEVPFDISRPIDTPYAPYELSKPESQAYTQPEFNTAFDLSRETNEVYEPPKQESKGFGIIGSLKSKLSSIDINKIQSSVTTFFDPAYNNTRKEATSHQGDVSYGQSQVSQGSSFEIFVPNVEQPTQHYNQTYGYQMSCQNTPYAQNQGSEQYRLQRDYNLYPSEGHNIYSAPGYYNTSTEQAHVDALTLYPSESYSIASTSDVQEESVVATSPAETISTQVPIQCYDAAPTQADIQTYNQQVLKSETNQPVQNTIQNEGLNSPKNIEQYQLENVVSNVAELELTDNIPDLQAKVEELAISFTEKDIKHSDTKNMDTKTSEIAPDFFRSPVNQAQSQMHALSSFVFNDSSDNLLDSQTMSDDKPNVPTFEVSALPLFGLSTMLADKTKELSQIENDAKDLAQQTQNFDTIFNLNSNVKFFDHMEPVDIAEIPDDAEYNKEPDLDICETCREVTSRSDDLPLDNDDLTTQLIENIVSPIQLLNPVEVPFTESNTPVDDRDDFESNQCAEISHITEETIETIQVQSATDLLDEDEGNMSTNVRTYGWCTDAPSQASAKVLADHAYSLHVNPNVIGFYGSDSTFMENMPTNASDEIKAEFKFTHDESPVILPRQMSLPTAPPAEDDSKLDETGIDVHLIEQDAKQDFPVFEEFVIEPSETDDDKIEYKERERGSEDPPELDSFTYRVERFKQMEETNEAYNIMNSFNFATTISPSIPIASYFDTGNYAAETHYRNSLMSPSNLTSFSIGSSNTIRIPPGFEEEYQRRLSRMSGFSGQEHLSDNRTDIPYSIPYIPDTSTQTRPTFSPTFSTAHNMPDTITASVFSKMSDSVQENRISSHLESQLPDFDSILGTLNEEKQNPEDILTLISNLNTDIQEAVFEKPILQCRVDSSRLPVFPNIIAAKTEDNIEKLLPESLVAVLNPEPPQIENSDSLNLDTARLPAFSSLFESKKESDQPEVSTVFPDPKIIENIKCETSITPDCEAVKPPIQEVPSLPDPINFFGSNEASTAQSSEDSGFNRLASYFASPTKSDDTKPFFELSQGQNHFRQHNAKPDPSLGAGDSTNVRHKSFFELSQSQNHYIENNTLQNIPDNKYLANLNLMRDLTSTQHVEVSQDQIVKTVNYFTVEYNNETLNIPNEFDKGEPEILKKDVEDLKTDSNLNETAEIGDKCFINVIKDCNHCNNLKVGYVKKYDNLDHEVIVNKDFKVRQAMDNNNQDKKDSDGSAEPPSRDSTTKGSIAINFGSPATQEQSNEGVLAMTENHKSSEYIPVKHHWFYRVDVEGKSTWRGFSLVDSNALEDAFVSPNLDDTTVVPTDGGRFDVNIKGRLRTSVYWSDMPTNVRRCSWFYKGTTDARYVPYTEEVAETLEEEYRHGVTTGEWHRRLVLPNNEMVVMHGPAVMVHFFQSTNTDAFSPPPQSATRPRVVRRGHEETEIEDIEPSNIDHLLLMCHGVGSACDMRFRSVEEVVDDFRTTSLQLLQSHYRNSFDNGVVGRVEVLPISWHATLHSGETGVDRRLARITLDSIPRLRSFTNDTVLDVLFYTSPVFCQTIIDTVCTELNRIYNLFRGRNPAFTGGVSLGGHSLGSVILYDLLSHQSPPSSKPPPSSGKRFVNGAAGTGQPAVRYPSLEFEPVALYALGSPIAIFECIRGVETLGMDFALPTCRHFFNIFHPYDPIAYRIEPLINPQLRGVKPYLIPHHKGRKRMHLELKDTMARVGADIKQKLIESIRSTWSSMWKSHNNDGQLEKVVEEEIEKEQLTEKSDDDAVLTSDTPTPDMLGQLNSGRRIDYVLQEAPLELINEYLFAMSSHVCYWESEDTMLLMLREIYDSLGVLPDCTVPQQSMTVQRNTRLSKNEDTIIMNASECPSTSRGGS